MWTAEAPANIALIKYMGKAQSEQKNLPCNSSLSYSIERFRSKVTLEISNEDYFENKLGLKTDSADRFVNHLKYIKNFLECDEKFLIKSENNFPHSSGIASSASSFAALTLCAFKAICEIKKLPRFSAEEMSKISRVASGSSCRSFFSPWALWERECAKPIDLPKLDHDLILVDASVKNISSGEAHKLVRTSLLFQGRSDRANFRLKNLIHRLKNDNWYDCYQICWEEFWDMHSLFETSCPHFGYIIPKTISVLNFIEHFWKTNNDGPIVTIDAGPNLHLLWKKTQTNLRNFFKNEIASRLNITFL